MIIQILKDPFSSFYNWGRKIFTYKQTAYAHYGVWAVGLISSQPDWAHLISNGIIADGLWNQTQYAIMVDLNPDYHFEPKSGCLVDF